MIDLLCHFARRFPLLASEILERDRYKTRNFREETITDILMAGLVPFEPFHILTNYPVDESVTGEDMDWEFIDEQAVDGRKYLRLHIQAKRAALNAPKTKPYWIYRELDHASGSKPKNTPKGHPTPKPKHGTQHQALLNGANAHAGCIPIYMFYHPASALEPASSSLPAVAGVNWMFADLIPKNVTPKKWPIADRRLDRWRPHFHILEDLLCFGHGPLVHKIGRDQDLLLLDGLRSNTPTPGEIEDRLNELNQSEGVDTERRPFRASEVIPTETLAIIRAGQEGPRKAEIPRPRITFISSGMTE